MRAPLLLAVLVASRSLGAQETTGSVRGRIITGASTAVAGAQITATSADVLGQKRAVSSDDGVFTLLALPPGVYTLRVVAIGFRLVIMTGLVVRLGQVTGLGSLPLDRAAVTLGEVTVTAPRQSIDPVGTAIGGTLEAGALASLPGDRDHKSLISMLPHINTSYHGDAPNSAGSTGLENLYFIDGVNVTSPFRATGGTSLPYNFIKSVEVRAGGYEAQYGRALGAIVNAVTHTGSNTHEAEVFGFFTNSALAAAPRNAPILQERGGMSYDLGGRVSGPLVRDRIWFSAALNPRRDEVERAVGSLGQFSDRRKATAFAAKLNWRASATTNLEVSAFGDPTVHHQVAPPPSDVPSYAPANPDAFLRRVESGGTSATVRGSSTFGAVLFEASLGLSWMRENDEGETALGREQGPYLDHEAQILAGGVHHRDLVSGRILSGTVRMTIPSGRHLVVLGVDYDAARVFRDFLAKRIDRWSADSFTLSTSGFAAGTVTSRAPAAYIQDAWRVSDRLTLNLGLRWSNQLFAVSGGSRAQRFTNQWQPRGGFSWQLGAAGRDRMFGSAGRYYQQEPLHLSSIYYLDFSGLQSHFHRDPRQAGAEPHHENDFSTPASLYTRDIDGVSAERFDEFTVGYERAVGRRAKLLLRGVYRNLGTTFQHGLDVSRCPPCWFLGTPGVGDLSFLPAPRREYLALEVSSQGEWGRVAYLTSYVLSRTWGNYPGLHNSDLYAPDPGGNFIMFVPAQAANSTGLLPNDRRHVFKFAASAPAVVGIQAGLLLTWQSGTPTNEFGVSPEGAFVFLVERGSGGRTPGLLDASVRLAYAVRNAKGRGPTLHLDLMHLTNSRSAVRVDQQRYFQLDADGNQTNPNPNFGKATLFVQPFMARLGGMLNF